MACKSAAFTEFGIAICAIFMIMFHGFFVVEVHHMLFSFTQILRYKQARNVILLLFDLRFAFYQPKLWSTFLHKMFILR